MIRKIITMIITMSLCTVLNAQYNKEVQLILKKVDEKYSNLHSFQMNLSFNISGPLLCFDDPTEDITLTVKGNSFRLDFSSNVVVVVNGKTIWTYLKEDNEVNISDFESEENEINPASIYKMWKTGYKYRLIDEETIGSKKYNVVELTPEDVRNQILKVKLWIDPTNYTIKKWKMFEKSGNRYTYEIKTFKENVSITPTIFTFEKTKYKGVIETDLRTSNLE